MGAAQHSGAVASSVRRWRPGALVVCAALLVGCGASTPVSASVFNAGDVMFLQMMVPHHRQGIGIVGLARDRARRPEITVLAAAIEATQASEMETMAGWLRSWGQPAVAAEDAHAAHGGMPGTSEADIATLATRTGVDFERDFLHLMIAHQDDAIQMARMETATGQNPAVRDLARRIDLSRSAQIQTMLAWLAG